jgi:predicted NAD/FAD-dependent oxidoreductase
VLDKGRSVGGRLATRRIGGATLDHGAQFFTVRSDEFRAEVDRWLTAGVAHEWCRGFDDVADGHPRYAAVGGLNRVAKHLAGPLRDVRTGVQVTGVAPADGGWRIAAPGVDLVADAVVLTAPVPQSLALLDAGSTPVRPDVEAGLRAVRYLPTTALLLVLDRPSAVPAPGARKPADGPFEIVVDNVAKGTSAEPALTLHLRPDLSAARAGEADESLLADLVPEAAAWLGDAA